MSALIFQIGYALISGGGNHTRPQRIAGNLLVSMQGTHLNTGAYCFISIT